MRTDPGGRDTAMAKEFLERAQGLVVGRGTRAPFERERPEAGRGYPGAQARLPPSPAGAPNHPTLLRSLGAGEGIRTLDPKLGKLVLYQLSYSRAVRGPYCPPSPGKSPNLTPQQALR